MSRDHFFCALLVLAVANGIEVSVVNSVTQDWYKALINSFDFSAVVWIACFAASALLYRSSLDEVITVPDAVIGLGVLSMTIVPFAKLSWLALTVLSLYMLSVGPPRSMRRRGALIALAVTGPMLWGPALMETFGRPILQADAILVSTLIGTARVGTGLAHAVCDWPAVFFSAWNVDRCSGVDYYQ